MSQTVEEHDLDFRHFRCCGDEDLYPFGCPRCGRLMVFCYECDTLFPDLTQTTVCRGLTLTSETDRVVCPTCGVAFKDYYFLRPENVERYLPTAGQVRDAGFGYLLSQRPR